MELYLFRHGEAEPVKAGGGDQERELTEEGRQACRAVAAAMWRAGVEAETICTSPLVRAQQTAQILSEVLGVKVEVDERLRPGARLRDIQDLLAKRKDVRMICVGHEPDLSTTVWELTGARVKMKAAGVARVETETLEPGAGVLVWLVGPELVGG